MVHTRIHQWTSMRPSPSRVRLALASCLCIVLLGTAGCGGDDPPVGPSDTAAPSVSIVQPVSGAVVGDSLTVELQATDDVGVTAIDILVDGQVIATLTTQPWRATIGITAVSVGVHQLVARARDAAGNAGSSAAVPFTRRNAELLFLRFRDGARFVFDRWDLDANSEKDPSTKGTYVTVYSAGNGVAIGNWSDWFRAVSTDSRFSRKDTLIVRTDTDDGDVMVHGFVTGLLQRFIRGAGGVIDPSGVTLPAPTWDVVGRFNADAATPLPIGTKWDITPSAGVNITARPSGFPTPITINVKLRAELAARNETVPVGSGWVRASRIVITVTVAVLFSRSDLIVQVWFSDDPAGQVRVFQQSGDLDLGLTSVPVPGDLQELVSFQ